MAGRMSSFQAIGREQVCNQVAPLSLLTILPNCWPTIRLNFLAHHHCPSIGCTGGCLVGGGAGLRGLSWNLAFPIFIMAYPYPRLTRSCDSVSMTLPEIHRLARVDDHGQDNQYVLPNRRAGVPRLTESNHFLPCLSQICWRRCGTRWQT